MNLDNYFKKVYTVAFRLTGDENKAANLAYNAISSSYYTLNVGDKVDSNMLNNTAKEVCRLFLTESDKGNEIFRRFENKTFDDSFQEALMSLNPLCRTMIVWRDVLGRNLVEMNITKHTKQELYLELNNARRLMKNFLNESYINETGA
ncbi:MAG: hypothetical protein AB7V48_08180 [Sedimentibacter sp.]